MTPGAAAIKLASTYLCHMVIQPRETFLDAMARITLDHRRTGREAHAALACKGDKLLDEDIEIRLNELATCKRDNCPAAHGRRRGGEHEVVAVSTHLPMAFRWVNLHNARLTEQVVVLQPEWLEHSCWNDFQPVTFHVQAKCLASVVLGCVRSDSEKAVVALLRRCAGKADEVVLLLVVQVVLRLTRHKFAEFDRNLDCLRQKRQMKVG